MHISWYLEEFWQSVYIYIYAFHNAYNFYVHQYMFFPDLNVLFHKCYGWQGYQMIKKILI